MSWDILPFDTKSCFTIPCFIWILFLRAASRYAVHTALNSCSSCLSLPGPGFQECVTTAAQYFSFHGNIFLNNYWCVCMCISVCMYLCVSVHVHVCVRVWVHVCVYNIHIHISQDNSQESIPSAAWVLRIELKSSSLVASSFTHGAISLT